MAHQSISKMAFEIMDTVDPQRLDSYLSITSTASETV